MVIFIIHTVLNEEAPFYYWKNLAGGWRSFFMMSKTMLAVGLSFIFRSLLYLEGWSSRPSHFIGVALCETFSSRKTFYPVEQMK